jgi:hypothetical protein
VRERNQGWCWRGLKGFTEIRKSEFILERHKPRTLVIDNVSIDDAIGTAVEALYQLIDERARQWR